MEEPEVNYLLTLRKRMKKDSKLPYAGDVNSTPQPLLLLREGVGDEFNCSTHDINTVSEGRGYSIKNFA